MPYDLAKSIMNKQNARLIKKMRTEMCGTWGFIGSKFSKIYPDKISASAYNGRMLCAAAQEFLGETDDQWDALMDQKGVAAYKKHFKDWGIG